MKTVLCKAFYIWAFAVCFLLSGTAQAAPQVAYRVHVAGGGWLNWVRDGAVAGTTGQGRQVEAIIIQSDVPLLYQVHVAGYGWLNWVSNGEGAGTTGQNRQMEAIRIRVANRYANSYNVYYRVHVAGYGWLDWVRDGAGAGTIGQSRQIEAIQIKLLSR